MKELTIEEKARRYDEALERARKEYKNHEAFKGYCEMLEHIFTELKEKESEDEKIRKKLIEAVKGDMVVGGTKDKQLAISWLEKQGEQKMKTPEESLGIDSDTYNKIVDECIYGEQKPTDNVEPKFKVGQTIKKEGFNSGFPIVKIENGFYYNDMGDNFPFTDQDSWELVEQKPTWSEENEAMWAEISNLLWEGYKHSGSKFSWDDIRNWVNPKLKSLKDRYTWKPSDEQMEALRKAEATVGVNHVVLAGLISDLEKLKE